MNETIDFLKDYLTHNHLLSAILLVFIASICVNIFTPRIIVVAKKKNLIIPIVTRSSHRKEISSLGGVAFFSVFLICIPLINLIHFGNYTGYNLITALTILFMVGLKDDLVNSSPRVKLNGQFMASFFVVLSPDFIISNYHGFLGIYEVDPIISILISLLFLVFFINSFNLIDGLDGLASIIGIVVTSTFIFLFMLMKDYFFAGLSLVTVSMLFAFLRFNLTNGKLKIFMGDCGSLNIGLIIGALSLRFLANEPIDIDSRIFSPENRILFIFSVLIIPLLDTFRVMTVRILNGDSPLKADRNHLHHLLLDFFKSHILVSLFLGVLNLTVIFIFIAISKTNSIKFVSSVMVLTTIIIIFGFYLINTINKKNKKTFNKTIKQ
ncbi:MAG: MraY family glycosyltransferase [Crocinitomicaceae bacterium]|nr:MraY family glycosyltransferase [Crocinitomicaceae bacterium]